VSRGDVVEGTSKMAHVVPPQRCRDHGCSSLDVHERPVGQRIDSDGVVVDAAAAQSDVNTARLFNISLVVPASTTS